MIGQYFRRPTDIITGSAASPLIPTNLETKFISRDQRIRLESQVREKAQRQLVITQAFSNAEQFELRESGTHLLVLGFAVRFQDQTQQTGGVGNSKITMQYANRDMITDNIVPVSALAAPNLATLNQAEQFRFLDEPMLLPFDQALEITITDADAPTGGIFSALCVIA